MSSLRNLIESKATGVVMFYGSACAPCTRMKPRLEALAERAGLQLHRLNVASEMEFAKANGIRGVPTVYALKEGVPTFLVTGEVGDLRMQELLAAAGLTPGLAEG